MKSENVIIAKKIINVLTALIISLILVDGVLSIKKVIKEEETK